MTLTLDDLSRMADADAEAWKAARALRRRGASAEMADTADAAIAHAAVSRRLARGAPDKEPPKGAPIDVPGWD